MAANPICYCSLINTKKMGIALLILCIFVNNFEKTFAVPDYKRLHDNLSRREDDEKAKLKEVHNHAGIPIPAEAGKVLKFSLEDYIISDQEEEPASVHIFEHGKTGLPQWLSYNERKKKLVGIPLESDVGKIKIILKSSVKNLRKKVKFELVVKEPKDIFVCHHGNPSLVAAALLGTDIENFNGLARLKLLRKFADYLDLGLHDIHVEEKKPGSVLDISMETAGPGDGIVTNAPGLIMKWKVNCKLGLPGDISVNILKASSGNKRVFNTIGVPFIGWYVYRQRQRYRRQAFPAPTPAATPAATIPVPVVTSVISGTPTISATPTLVVKSTSTVAVKATTSGTILKPTPVVTTERPTAPPETTTKPPTTTTKAPTTTTKPPTTTTKPPTTTEKPTTVEVTTQPETTTTELKTTTMKPEITTMKPEKTSMKPETTAKVPETTKMVPETTAVVKPTVKDNPPVLKNSIDLIAVTAGQAFKLKIEKDVFEDDIDGDTYNLHLALKRNDAQKLTAVDKSLIFLDTKNYYLYGLPTLANVGDNSFALQATDRSGNQKNAVFTVRVADDALAFNYIFNVTVDTDYSMFMKNAKNKVNLVEKLAEASETSFNSVRLQNFYPGSVVMSYSSTEFQTDDCNSVKAQAYKAKLEGSSFKDAMAPDFIVLETSSKKAGTNCAPPGPKKSPRGEDDGGYKWWEVVLIPVIVIAVLLLVIGLIFFFLYRRKRRYEPSKEDKNTFLYQKKPVIFQEEYQEKPDLVSLQPLILPAEKAPLSDQAYQPRSSTPEGNGSSSSSTEADDKVLINNKTPQTPPPSSPPRSPLYGRSPPPYTEP